MDYLEGMLLHAWWSDTDYASRKHTGTWLWYSVFSFFALAYAALRLNLDGTLGVIENSGVWLALAVALFILTPLFCLVYYKLPLLLRVPVLLLLGLKYLAFFLLWLVNLASLFIIPETMTLSAIMVWGNDNFGAFLEDTTARMGVTGLFVGGVILVLIGVGIFLAVMALVIFVPILILKAFNAMQLLWDSLVVWLFGIAKRLIKAYRSSPDTGRSTTNGTGVNVQKQQS